VKLKERLAMWGSCGGLVLALALASGVTFVAYQIDKRTRPQATPRDAERVLMRMTDTSVQIWGSGENAQLVAEVQAAVVEVNQDQTLTQVFDVSGIRIYRDGQLYMTGGAKRATYDEQLKELRIFDGVQLDKSDDKVKLSTEEIVYYIDTKLLVATEPVTAEMSDATLKTATARVNVTTQRFQAPRQVVVSSSKGSQLVADAARGDLDANNLTLVGNVVMDATVGELKKAAKEAGAPSEPKAEGVSDESRVRMRCERADIDLENNAVTASGHVSVVAEEGSAMGQTAEIAQKSVKLAGGVTITLRGKGSTGPITVETPMVEYDTEADLAVCPSAVNVSMREGTFKAGRAEARLKQGSWRLLGGVKGTIQPSVL